MYCPAATSPLRWPIIHPSHRTAELLSQPTAMPSNTQTLSRAQKEKKKTGLAQGTPPSLYLQTQLLPWDSWRGRDKEGGAYSHADCTKTSSSTERIKHLWGVMRRHASLANVLFKKFNKSQNPVCIWLQSDYDGIYLLCSPDAEVNKHSGHTVGPLGGA